MAEASQDLYAVLGVSKDVDAQQLKRAYRKRAIKTHPDKGGNAEEFKKVTAAYKVLSDPEKRALYDKHGLPGLKADFGAGGRGGMGGMDDFFSSFFSMGMRQPRGDHDHLPKEKAVLHPLPVTLEDLYRGKVVSLQVRRRVIVKDNGKPVEGVTEVRASFGRCRTCGGTGYQVHVQRIGPGMIRQIQSGCAECSAKGFRFKDGYSLVSRQHTLTVVVEKGMRHKQKLVQAGMGHMRLGALPGDIVVVLQQQPHKIFKRKGHDLCMLKQVTLRQAVSGFSFVLHKMDGSDALIQCPRSTDGGMAVVPGVVRVAEDMGMPIPGTCEFGRLFIVFQILFPTAAQLSTPGVREAIVQALPVGPLDSKPDESKTADMDFALLAAADPKSFGAEEHVARTALDSDDEEEYERMGSQECHMQ